MQGLKVSESTETVPSDNDSTPKSQEGKRTPKSKKTKASKKDRLNPARFQGDGVSFKAKLIGVEELNEPRGDKLCQETITRLKAAIKSTGTHKQRIWFSISLEGIKIREDRSLLDALYQHTVPQISFISQDMTDDRAFGYICSPMPDVYQFVAIKTEKAASQVVLTLRDLFQTVLDMKQKQSRVENAEAKEENMPESCLEETTESAVQVPVEETNGEPIYSTVDGVENKEDEEVEEEECVSAPEGESDANRQNLFNLVDLQFEPNVQQLEESIVTDQTPKEEIPDAEEEKEDEDKSAPAVVDRYAVFEDLDSEPSIFDQPLFTASATLEAVGQFSVHSDKDSAQDELKNGRSPSPLPPASKESSGGGSSKPWDFSILAELDPLGKDRPYVDRKDFFHDIKNPPKKILKDLVGSSFDASSNNGVSIYKFESQDSNEVPPRIPPRVNPFSSNSLPPSTPPPMLTMTSRCSDPMFPVSPSPPPPPPLPQSLHRAAPCPVSSLDGPQSPPIPIPPRRASPLANEDSPLSMRRSPRLGSESDKTFQGTWGTFDDNFNDAHHCPVALPKPSFVFPNNKQIVIERPKNPFANFDKVFPTKVNMFNPFVPTIDRLTPPPTPPITCDASSSSSDVSSDVFSNSDVFNVSPPYRTSPPAAATTSDLISPDEGSIFRRKQDPFADDFFQAFDKK